MKNVLLNKLAKFGYISMVEEIEENYEFNTKRENRVLYSKCVKDVVEVDEEFYDEKVIEESIKILNEIFEI